MCRAVLRHGRGRKGDREGKNAGCSAPCNELRIGARNSETGSVRHCLAIEVSTDSVPDLRNVNAIRSPGLLPWTDAASLAVNEMIIAMLSCLTDLRCKPSASTQLSTTQRCKGPYNVCQERFTLRDAAPNKTARANESDWESSWRGISRRRVDWNQLQIRWEPHRNFGRCNLSRAQRAVRQHRRGGRSRTIRSAAPQFFVIGGLSVVSSRHRAAGQRGRACGTGAAQQRQRNNDGKNEFDHKLALKGASLGVKFSARVVPPSAANPGRLVI